MTIAFDVDGTLFDENNQPRANIKMLLIALHDARNRIVVWSGGGVDYARTRVHQLEITEYVDEIRPKHIEGASDIDISIDDQDVRLGTWRIKV